MNKQIFILLFALAGVSVSCEKSDWFSPDEVNSIKATYQDQVNDLTTANNTLTSQAVDLTAQVGNLTTSVSTLESEVSSLTTSNSTLSSNTTVNLNTIAGLNTDVSSLTTQVASLTANIATLDAEIVTLNTAITNSASSTTGLTSQVASLTTSVASLTAEVATLEAQADALEAEILIFKDFKTLRDKIDALVAATITDAKLNTAVDNVSAGLTTTSITSTTLKGLIADESNWIFNNAIKTGTVSMTVSATTFYDSSTDTNVVNFRNLVTEMTTAWNALKETQFILWWIEFIKEYENL
jgi:phage shock protein A